MIGLREKRALQRLASCYSATQKEIIERVLDSAETEALAKADRVRRGQDNYYDMQLQLTINDFHEAFDPKRHSGEVMASHDTIGNSSHAVV